MDTPPCEPTLSWGAGTRGLGLVYAIAFASLGSQILAMAGSRGITPALPVLRQLAADFPSPLRRFWYFPSLLHTVPLSSAPGSVDALLQAVCACGFACGLAMIHGGAIGQAAACLAWALLLSLDLVADLNYPWDCLLLEAGFLATLLPATHPLLPGLFAGDIADLGAVGPPTPAVAWAFRWLLFRVLFGFGKLKFIGTGPKDSCYVRAFLIGMPIPTPAAYVARAAPLVLHQLALVGMFLIEIPLPFGVFLEGLPRTLAALGIASLQFGIALTGNFGHFNVLTVVLCLPLLDGLECPINSPTTAEDLSATAQYFDTALYCFYGFLGCANLPFNSWCARSWAYWPALVERWGPATDAAGAPTGNNPVLGSIIAFGRATATWRLCHSYGVFPPHSSPPARFVAVLEASADGGKSWRRYRYRYMTSNCSHAPVWVAPHHPRWDHAVFYEGFGMNAHNWASSLNVAHPYRLSRSTPLHRVAQRILEGDGASPVELALFGDGNPFPPGEPRPTRIRAKLQMFTVAGEVEAAAAAAEAGAQRWWDETELAEHLPETGLDPAVWDEWLPPRPELWHPDVALLWRRRSADCGNSHALALMAHPNEAPVSGGVDDALAPTPASLADAPTAAAAPNAVEGSVALRDIDIDSLWTVLLPAWTDAARKATNVTSVSANTCKNLKPPKNNDQATVLDWSAALQLGAADAVRARFGTERLRVWEVGLGRLTTVLFERYLPSFRRGLTPGSSKGLKVPENSYFELWLCCNVAVLRGRACWEQCWSASISDGEGSAMPGIAAASALPERLAWLALFWPETLAFHAAKGRLSGCIISSENAPVPDKQGLVPGFVHLVPELATYYTPAAGSEREPALGFPPGWGDWDMNPASGAPDSGLKKD